MRAIPAVAGECVRRRSPGRYSRPPLPTELRHPRPVPPRRPQWPLSGSPNGRSILSLLPLTLEYPPCPHTYVPTRSAASEAPCVAVGSSPAVHTHASMRVSCFGHGAVWARCNLVLVIVHERRVDALFRFSAFLESLKTTTPVVARTPQQIFQRHTMRFYSSAHMHPVRIWLYPPADRRSKV